MVTAIDNSPINAIFLISLLSLLPIIFVMTSSFIKISMVMLLTRESLGVQQIPPNIVIYSLSLVLSFYVMGPVYNNTIKAMSVSAPTTGNALLEAISASTDETKKFLLHQTPYPQQQFFYQSLKEFWTPEMMKHVKADDLVVLVPAFMVSEITKAFKIGFLIYLPSVIIDIIVSNILMAMGMMMMSPQTISLPIKLLLFITLDGWARLIHALLGSYVI
ncbi:MAG: type III secretion system export apparatus subunit SctR [Burkholderiales bacterium]|nr:type III secretion system export apparatus subunit SctR [Burkholderiales bacterium]